MKKLLSSIFILMIVVLNGTSYYASDFENQEIIENQGIIENQETVEKQGRGGPQGETYYRWIKVSSSSVTTGDAYKTCVSNGTQKKLSCSISQSRASSVSGNSGICVIKDCLVNAGISVTHTKSYDVKGNTEMTPGKKGGKIQYSYKTKTVTTKYRKQEKKCSGWGTTCGYWQNTSTTKNVTSKGDYYVHFRYINN